MNKHFILCTLAYWLYFNTWCTMTTEHASNWPVQVPELFQTPALNLDLEVWDHANRQELRLPLTKQKCRSKVEFFRALCSLWRLKHQHSSEDLKQDRDTFSSLPSPGWVFEIPHSFNQLFLAIWKQFLSVFAKAVFTGMYTLYTDQGCSPSKAQGCAPHTTTASGHNLKKNKALRMQWYTCSLLLSIT